MKRRWCHEVIAEMLTHIPSAQVELIKALEWNAEDSFYKAPEETLQWERTMQTLQKFIPSPTSDWEYKVLSIFTTRPIDELKEMFK